MRGLKDELMIQRRLQEGLLLIAQDGNSSHDQPQALPLVEFHQLLLETPLPTIMTLLRQLVVPLPSAGLITSKHACTKTRSHDLDDPKP